MERDLRLEQVRPRTLERVQGARLGRGEQLQRRVGRAGVMLGMRRGERAGGAPRGVRRQLDGALEEGRRRGKASPRSGPCGGALELRGDILVESLCRLSAVPGAPIRVRVGVGGCGERPMHPVAVVGGCSTVSGGSYERVTELDTHTHLEEAGVRRRVGRGHVDAERLGGTLEKDGITQRLRGGRENEQLGVGGKLKEAPRVALFDLARDRLPPGQSESAGEIHRAPRARKLQQRERVAVALGDDLVADGRVQRAEHIVQQECARVADAESADGHCRQPGEDVVTAAGAGGKHERDPLGEEAPADESEDLCGGLVEPLRVVDDADERLFLGDLGEQRERGEPDQEPVGRRAGAPAEYGCERVALGDGQPVELIQHGSAELMEAAVGQLHLRLDADGPGDAPAGDTVGQVAEQRALAHTRLAPQHRDAALTAERVGQDAVERLTFGTTSDEPHPRPP